MTTTLPRVHPTPERPSAPPRPFWKDPPSSRDRPRSVGVRSTARSGRRRSARTRPHTHRERPSLIDPIADTLTLLLPGTGHMLRGRWATGLAMTSWVGLILALGWAVHETLARMDSTLPLLTLPREAGVWLLGGLFGGLAVLHVTAVTVRDSETPVAAHPLASGIASGLIPGWGQLLNGHRFKAAIFVAALWVIVASWGLASETVARLLERFDLFLPPLLESFRSPLVHRTALAVVWTLSLYDAVTSANADR